MACGAWGEQGEERLRRDRFHFETSAVSVELEALELHVERYRTACIIVFLYSTCILVRHRPHVARVAHRTRCTVQISHICFQYVTFPIRAIVRSPRLSTRMRSARCRWRCCGRTVDYTSVIVIHVFTVTVTRRTPDREALPYCTVPKVTVHTKRGAGPLAPGPNVSSGN